jgi:hypothetical protein
MLAVVFPANLNGPGVEYEARRYESLTGGFTQQRCISLFELAAGSDQRLDAIALFN